MNSGATYTNDRSPSSKVFMDTIPGTENTYESLHANVYTCLDRTAPSNRSTEAKSSAGREYLYRKISLVFVSLWLITLITLIVGMVLHYDQRSAIQREMEVLKNSPYKLIGGTPKVAFAASLANHSETKTIGPYSEDVTVVYTHVITNVGGAYNQSTGIFTVPIRGTQLVKRGLCCAIHKEMRRKSVRENRRSKSPDTEELSEKQSEAPMPRHSAQGIPDKRKLAALSICVVIITLACITTVFYFYFMKISEIQSEMKELKDYLDAWEGPSKVAFSAALRIGENVTLGPYRQFHILVYKNVYTNIGGAYNISTGIFTVPVRGVYRFFFTAFGWDERTGVLLYMDEEYVMGNYDNNPGQGRGATNMVTLELEVGQNIYLGLSMGRRLYVSTGNYNLFNGWLLFAL
ncbi:hypothetical protein ANANG_G00141130 [Anguilla anguilla]|uniref:C1q domain-containing protein n=1 Tax=Anguilla anguilla TaxID=7936 RepID=A0A9D3MAS0_ANGAN|nr:hypothetical protein ANANG_G00141130 [Anguilla anguilla]